MNTINDLKHDFKVKHHELKSEVNKNPEEHNTHPHNLVLVRGTIHVRKPKFMMNGNRATTPSFRMLFCIYIRT